MKKILILILAVLLLLGGCSLHKGAPQIEDYRWALSSVQGGEDGRILACAPGELLPAGNAQEIEMEGAAANGMLSLDDRTNHQSYSGSYRRRQADRRSNIYEITLDGREGIASVSMTQYHDGTQIPTFIIRLDDHALTFHAAADR